jgi:hypothetical protein
LLRFARTGTFIAFTGIIVFLSQEDYQISMPVGPVRDVIRNFGQPLVGRIGIRGLHQSVDPANFPDAVRQFSGKLELHLSDFWHALYK